MTPNLFTKKLSRRKLVLASAAGVAGAGLAGLHLASPPRPAFAETTPWTGDVPAASRSSRQMATAALAFVSSLEPEKIGRVVYPDLANAARTKWSNFPAGASPRAGLALSELTDAQRVLMHNLLRASTSSQGYLKATGAMRADDLLSESENNNTLFGSANYYTSVYGNPQDSAWAWMLTGHHMSVMFTVAGDRTAFTPMFTGAQPLQATSGLSAGWQSLPQEASRGGELLSSLSGDQKGTAVIAAAAPGDVIAGPARQQGITEYAGIPTGKLDDGQQHLLWLLIQEYVRNADFDAAEAQLSLIQDGWKDTHFAWMGPAPAPDARFYYRVHGPRILIEYDVQDPLTKDGGHVHAITRDPTNDYGADWLGLHYTETSSVGAGGGGAPGGPRGPQPAPTP